MLRPRLRQAEGAKPDKKKDLHSHKRFHIRLSMEFVVELCASGNLLVLSRIRTLVLGFMETRIQMSVGLYNPSFTNLQEKEFSLGIFVRKLKQV